MKCHLISVAPGHQLEQNQKKRGVSTLAKAEANPKDQKANATSQSGPSSAALAWLGDQKLFASH